jgi:hypothetical protein
MTHIVTTHYRYKRPPRKRKPIEIEGPAIVRKRGRADVVAPPTPVEEPKPGNDNRPAAATSPHDGTKSAIVTIKRRSRFRDAPDLTPEEYQRRAAAADAMWRELVRRVARERCVSGSPAYSPRCG